MGTLRLLSWAISRIPDTVHWLSPPLDKIKLEKNFLYVKLEISILILWNIRFTYRAFISREEIFDGSSG